MTRLSLRRPVVALAGLVTLVAVVALTVVPAALNSSQKHRLSASVVTDTKGPVPADGQAWMTIHVSNENDFVNVGGRMRSRELVLNAFVVSSIDVSVAVDGVQHPEWNGNLVPPPYPDPLPKAFSGRWITTVTCPDSGPPCTVVGHPAVVPGEDAVVFYYGWGHAPYSPWNEPNGEYVFTYTLHGTVNGEAVDLVATSPKIEMVGVGEPAPKVPVSLTVEWEWNGSPATIIAGVFPGCAAGTVETDSNPDQQKGDEWIFTGSKTFLCASDNTFTADYKVSRIGDATTVSGTWKVTGGTGMYEGMKGGGDILGAYMFDQSTPPNRIGITDTFTGKVHLR